MTDLTPPPNAARLAEKLTAAQRAALLRRVTLWGGRIYPDTEWMTVGRPMLAQGLIRFVVDPRSTATELTPLGLAVRALVKP